MWPNVTRPNSAFYDSVVTVRWSIVILGLIVIRVRKYYKRNVMKEEEQDLLGELPYFVCVIVSKSHSMTAFQGKL